MYGAESGGLAGGQGGSYPAEDRKLPAARINAGDACRTPRWLTTGRRESRREQKGGNESARGMPRWTATGTRDGAKKRKKKYWGSGEGEERAVSAPARVSTLAFALGRFYLEIGNGTVRRERVFLQRARSAIGTARYRDSSVEGVRFCTNPLRHSNVAAPAICGASITPAIMYTLDIS